MREPAPSDRRLADIAVRYGFLTDAQMKECREDADRRGLPLISVLIERDHVCASDVTTLRALAALKNPSREEVGPEEEAEVLSLKIVERGFATGEQVEQWMDDWLAVSEPRPRLAQFLLHRGLLSSDQVNVLETAPAASAEPAVGSRFGKYLIQSVLGEGAAGYVFRAVDLDLQRTVAIKVLKQTESMLPQHLQRFLREAKIMANLRHPNIVPVYEVGVQDGRYYYTMDYVSGTTLESALDEKRLTRPELIEILEMVARALSFAHQCGVIHRDLKPSNILLDGRTPRIMDFGLAKTEREDGRLTKAGTIMGSPVYMPPEQVEGTPRVDTRSDVYSLGVILYEAAAGALPYDAPQMPDLFARILEGEPQAPRRRDPSISADLEKVILKAMHREAARRYPTMDELADDLKRVREGEPVRASGASRFTVLVRRMKKHRRVLYAATAAALAVLGLFGAVEYYRVRESTKQSRAQSILADALGAIARYDLAVYSHPDDVRAAIPMLGKALDDLGAVDAPEADPLRGKVLMRLGRRDEAERWFERQPDLADGDRGINLLLRSFPELPPQNTILATRASREGSIGTALAAIFTGQTAAALTHLREIEGKLEGRRQAELRKVLALVQLLTKDYEGAAASAEGALAVRRVDPDLLWMSSYAAFHRPPGDDGRRKSDMRRAIERLELALAVGTDTSAIEKLLLRCYGDWAGFAMLGEPFDDGLYRRGAAIFESVPSVRRDRLYYLNRAHFEAWKYASWARRGKIDAATFKLAKAAYEKAVEFKGDDSVPHLGIGMLYYFTIQEEFSRGEEDAKKFEAAMIAIRRSVAARPDYIPAWILMTELDSKRLQFKLSQGNVEDADFAEARDRAEGAPHPVRHVDVWHVAVSSLYIVYFNHLVNARNVRESIYEQGLAACERAIHLNPKATGAWINMGVLKSLRYAYHAAIQLPTDEIFNEALQAFEEALKIEPGSTPALNGLGSMYSKHYRELLGRGNDSDLIFQRAAEIYAQALRLAPTSISSRYNLAKLHVSRVEHYVKKNKPLASERLETAQKLCEAVLAQNPGLPMGKDLLGEMLYLKCLKTPDLKDVARAKRINEEAVEAGYRQSGYTRLAGLCEIKQDFKAALNLYSLGIEACPLNNERASLHRSRAALHERLGNCSEALADYEEALRLDPSAEPELRPLIERLGGK